jgi:hypothetical protein
MLPEESELWFCCRCGEVYARRELGGRWRAFPGCCFNCQPHNSSLWQIPGSVWLENNMTHNSKLPAGIIQKEFDLTINAFLKGELQWQTKKVNYPE